MTIQNDENVIWHPNKVTPEDRQRVLGHPGLVVWFTGLSGSGKSTIAVELEKMLNEGGRAAYLLDGDNIRKGINADLGFSDEDRDENIRRISEIAALFCDAGPPYAGFVYLAVSPYAGVCRERIGSEHFIEVYVSTEYDICRQRDPKGLYKKNIKNFTGKDSTYEEPLHPDVVLDTVGTTPVECAKIVYEEILKKIK